MALRACRARIAPLTAFGTPPLGDTFFGQLCWAVRNRYGDARLSDLLQGYTQGNPFAVVSDAFPGGYLPRPTLPGRCFEEIAGEDRKAVKRRAWLPVGRFQEPVQSWLSHCVASSEIPGGVALERPQPHNTISRTTGTTGEGQFAPYGMSQLWYGRKQKVGAAPLGKTSDTGARPVTEQILLDLYVVLDAARAARLDLNELRVLLADIGHIGFGRDASIGLGKFGVIELGYCDLPAQNNADGWMTLAPCAPQGLACDERRCFYRPFTRFGRHGDVGVHKPGGPFKTPVLLASTGAVLAPSAYQPAPFTGRGLGGDGGLSKAIPETVHQGYAPVAAIRIPQESLPQEVAA